MTEYPDFDSLPRVEGQPQGNAWGLWGKEDQLGTLNLLTPSTILSATKEVRLGKSTQLDLRLDYLETGIAGRERFEHTIVDFQDRNKGTEYELFAHDDVIKLNTQSSSQWDGLRHVGLQKGGVYYNGMKHRDIDEGSDGRLGIQKWAENGGIVGRGILLDYVRWRKETGKQPAPPNTPFAIPVADLDAVAKFQNVEFKDGDILIIRSGFTEWYNNASSADRKAALDGSKCIGVEASMTSVKWLWNHHFAAVAGDALGFEVAPAPFGVEGKVCLHEWLLVHWGTPIGEIWDLETLGRQCEESGKWSFMLTSAPLNVFGGVGSTPNAIAIL